MIHDGSLSEFSIVKVKKLQCNNMQVHMDKLCTKYVLLAYLSTCCMLFLTRNVLRRGQIFIKEPRNLFLSSSLILRTLQLFTQIERVSAN